jgi:hypothetical protein
VWWTDPAPGTPRARRQRDRLQARLEGRGDPTLRVLWPAVLALVLAAAVGAVLLVWADSRRGVLGVVLVAVVYLGGLVRAVLWRGAVVRRRRGHYTAAELARLGELQLPALVRSLLRRDGWQTVLAPHDGHPRILGTDVVFRLAGTRESPQSSGPRSAVLRAVGTRSHDGVIRLVVALDPFPRDDVLWASRQGGLHLVDGELIRRWADGEPVQQLLGLGPLPRRTAS